MSICTPALLTQTIPTCLGILEVGYITPSITISVYINDITIDKTFIIQESSNGTGRVLVDLTDYEFSDRHSYELWMTNPQEPTSNYVPFLVEGTTDTTEVAQLKFMQISENGSPFPFPSVVLKAA